MNIFLISNDVNLTSEKILTLNISDNDLVCLFNHANPIKYDKIYNHPHKYIFLRANIYDYWGYQEAIYNHKIYKKLFLINEHRNNINTLKQYFADWTVIYDSLVKEYPENKQPTSGFVVHTFIHNMFPKDDIFLVNFTGKSSTGGEGWRGHNYEFEQQYYSNNNITIL